MPYRHAAASPRGIRQRTVAAPRPHHGRAGNPRRRFADPAAAPAERSPEVYVEVGFASGVTSGAVTWTGVTTYAQSLSWRRGRRREAARYEAGELAVTLDNRDRRFEPEFAGGAYHPNVRPNRRVRVRTHYAGLDRTHIVAYADSWGQRYDNPRNATAELSATDGFKVLSRARLPGSAWGCALALVPGLTHWWRLGEKDAALGARDSAGTITGVYTDPSTLGAEGLVVGDPDACVDLSVTGTVTFDGLPTAPVPAPPFTIACWFSPSLLPGFFDEFPTVVSQGSESAGDDHIALRLTDDEQPRVEFDVDGGSTGIVQSAPDTVRRNAVHFAAGSWDGSAAIGALRLYLDGTAYTGTASGAVASFSSRDFIMGDGFDQLFVPGYFGLIDEVVVFDRVLTTAELDLLYRAGTPEAHNALAVTDALSVILDYVRWPGTARSLTAGRGTTVLHPKWLNPADQRALDLMESLMASDRGALYMDASGSLAAVTQAELLSSGPTTSPQAVLGPGAGEIPFSVIALDYDEEPVVTAVTIANSAHLTGQAELAETALTASRGAAVDEFGEITADLDLVISTGEDASLVAGALADRAEYELDQFSEPQLRVTRVVIKPMRDPVNLWAKVLSLDLLQRVTVKHTVPAGGTITKNLTIEGIAYEHDVPSGDWSVTLDLSGGGMPSHTYWILGVPGFSELGTTTYLGLGE